MPDAGGVQPGSPGGAAEVERGVRPSFRHALPYFLPLAVFPLVALAGVYGGFWIVAPFAFFWIADALDRWLGAEERNMDPRTTLPRQLFWYQTALWVWVALWPLTLVFTWWRALVVGSLAFWEVLLVALALGHVASMVLVAAHELIHQRSVWPRRVGEFLLASIGCAHYATEHVYVHHVHVATPRDPVSARKGQGFWEYLPHSIIGSFAEAWRAVAERLARRRLPIWHHTNPFWRYLLGTGAWVALAWWMAGAWGLLVFAIQGGWAIFSLRLGDYIEHYGLQRVRLPGGRFERFQLHHSWNAARKASNWLYYNTQRHSDHHVQPTRTYPLLQNHGWARAPRLPAGYARVFGLATSPKRWFEAMDPLVERWRASFYPQIEDWSVYDSPAFAARPESFEAIREILAAAPRLGAWTNRAPELLDCLKDREFADLDLPNGFGPDPESEAIARRGLARLYWTHEFGVSEMKRQIAEFPAQDVREAVEVARDWSNGKTFQIGVHTMRGNLSPTEAGAALSNVAEASITAVLTAVAEDPAGPRAGGGVAAVVLGDLASGETPFGVKPDWMFVYDGDPSARQAYESLCDGFFEALRALATENILLAPVPSGRGDSRFWPLNDFERHYRNGGALRELSEMTRARCIYTHGDRQIASRFEAARRRVLTGGAPRQARIALRATAGDPVKAAAEPGLPSFDDLSGGLHHVEGAARWLQLTRGGDALDIRPQDAASVFQVAGDRGWIPDEVSERLAGASRMWRNLRVVLPLVAENGGAVATAGPQARAVIARSCGMDDFRALGAAIRETAARAASDIESLGGNFAKGRA